MNTTCLSYYAIIIAIILGHVPTQVMSDDKTSDQEIQFFETSIRPLLLKHCTDCHGADSQESDLRLDSLSGMLNGGKAGPALLPGKPEGSLIVTAVSYRDNDLKMPPDEKLSKQEIADLTRWVQMGAPHPDADLETASRRPTQHIDIAEGRKHWAFRPVKKPEVPSQGNNPVDAFISRSQQLQGILPLGPADKRTLIRRATFDLIGLPPTIEEIENFVNDNSADAFEKVVDRLLDSPHYGERQARHWLDIARYADSNGLDENVAHGNAWRYRDYVVESLNQDKPYSEFLREQLAGDLLESGDDYELRNVRLIATGYLVLGPKVLAEVDGNKMEMDIVDEQLDTIGRGLMGLTLGCARCHDHKFDPIGNDDYYGLAGIFKSTRAMETFEKVARWNENPIPTTADIAKEEQHTAIISAKKEEISTLIASASDELKPPTGETLPADVEKRFPEETQTQLKLLREELKTLESNAPVMPTAMGVKEGTIADTAIHLRGSHLTLGNVVPRRFPRVLAGDQQPEISDNRSGRLEFANWLTDGDHPLTARVMVNRIWNWHFGTGLVPTVDNFGLQGTPPTHPELLDWLANRFIEEGWSVKAMHRQIMLSDAYQRSSGFDSQNAENDPGNLTYWKFNIRRLKAESLRDAMLAVSGTLDPELGGNLLEVKNRDYLFNHTSQDKSTYNDIRRRSLYLPVIRNHLYDLFQLFDYTDASVLNGKRETSTIAPQALLLMNSELITDLTTSMAQDLLRQHTSNEDRIEELYLRSYGRAPDEQEVERVVQFLSQFEKLTATNDEAEAHAWQALCQAIVSSSEFLYIR
ncbi:PSD1 and planctomycete cytochrome C domain-containing protein [Rubinisphaera sp.]|uniref:PSD1 and planctomycete cytochrome C domain-containing protein n=1 Tax=Rubinisphaera sp. TaxID=2024857 RepID=UPI0025E53F04|nr:PSD1 and planctomycete cytochrome C domain-containing protein [Rubinisphaera sp.]|tara:strand:- start:2175 stop:4607 length:2433 start_codon:yes stop_codon:yes gene_type:complete